VRVTDRALQVHGGHGYARELPIERCYREGRGLPDAPGVLGHAWVGRDGQA